MTTIETIRAELLRHKELFKEAADVGGYYASARRDEVNELLSFLDTLQEQPVCEDVDEEIYKAKAKVALAFGGVTGEQDRILIGFARHFYELGRQSKEQPIRKEALVEWAKKHQCEQGFEDGEAEHGYQSAIQDLIRYIESL